MGKVIKFPNKEKQEERTPLFVSHQDGRIKGNPHHVPRRYTTEELSDRIYNIRKSLEKINTLMAELKKQKGRRDYDR
jgi:hypothetical protein